MQLFGHNDTTQNTIKTYNFRPSKVLRLKIVSNSSLFGTLMKKLCLLLLDFNIQK